MARANVMQVSGIHPAHISQLLRHIHGADLTLTKHHVIMVILLAMVSMQGSLHTQENLNDN